MKTKSKKTSRSIAPPSGHTPSELRRDLVTGNWVVIARERAKRPNDFKSKLKEENICLPDDPFADPQAFGNAEPLLLYKDKKGDWTVQVIPNKYPAFGETGQCAESRKSGPYKVMDGRGFHEVVISRSCKDYFALLPRETAIDVLKAYQERYSALKGRECVKYISIFENHGREAGASLAHPHSQIIAIPVIPPEVLRSLEGSKRFFDTANTCVHCAMIAWEKKDKVRVIFENSSVIAFCPFISRTAFEIHVFPKEHHGRFENFPSQLLPDLAEAMQKSLLMLNKTLKNPAYNFFVHTSPADGTEDYAYYHWHVEILPKTAVWAGFELGTGIDISTIEPERAAVFLKGKS